MITVMTLIIASTMMVMMINHVYCCSYYRMGPHSYRLAYKQFYINPNNYSYIYHKP